MGSNINEKNTKYKEIGKKKMEHVKNRMWWGFRNTRMVKSIWHVNVCRKPNANNKVKNGVTYNLSKDIQNFYKSHSNCLETWALTKEIKSKLTIYGKKKLQRIFREKKVNEVWQRKNIQELYELIKLADITRIVKA